MAFSRRHHCLDDHKTSVVTFCDNDATLRYTICVNELTYELIATNATHFINHWFRERANACGSAR